MLPQTISKYALRYQHQKPWVALILFVSYVSISLLTSYFLPNAEGINPAIGIALSALFFSDLRFAPIAYFAALISGIVSGMPLMSLVVMPLAVTAAASAGAYLLRICGVDPIFRRKRDVFYFIAIAAGVSFIPLIVWGLANIADVAHQLTQWGHVYIGTLFSIFIPVPFLLRWFAKPKFSRTYKETIETTTSLAVLLLINIAYFIFSINEIFGIPLVYLLLAPLFWIALRLRPRFVTLALLITSSFGVWGAAAGVPIGMGVLDVELLMIAFSINFLIITTQEEDRRVSTNLVLSQLATLENIVARVNTESSAKNDFIAILAHELRNPLAPVVSSIDLLKLKGPRDEEEAEILDMMEDRMRTIRYLLDDLLDVSRISEGKITLNYEQVDIESAIRAAILSTEHHRLQLHQHLKFAALTEPVHISADRVRIEQVFSNLLTNASKYSPSGSSITVSAKAHDGFAEIIVTDQGHGLDKNELETIFLPFQQAHDTKRNPGGLGIGLALVRNFVEIHGGTVFAKSPGRGKGSSFIVRLPILPPRIGSNKPDISQSNMLAERPKHGYSILIVDDNDAAAAGLGRLLEIHRSTVTYAYDGRQAIQKVDQEAPDVILLDIQLPDMDGRTVASKLRKHGFTGKIIALSGYSANDFKKGAKGEVFDEYLTKPVGLSDLKRVLPSL